MNAEHCPDCGYSYDTALERYRDGGKEYEPVFCARCQAWHENVYVGTEYIGTETRIGGAGVMQ